jgi:hypothetical protein
MRVLIVSYYFPPYMNVGGFRPMSWARRLYDRGHDVTVIRGDGQEADSCAYFSENLDRPVKVINVHNPMLREPVPEKPGEPNKPSPSPTIMDKLKETIKPWLPMVDSYFIWARQAIAAARDEIESSGGFDAVISTSFPLSAHEVARAVKKKLNCRWIADFRDFYGQFDSNAVDRDSPRGRFLARRFASYGKEIDLAITVSGKLKPLVDKALDIDTTTILYNGYFEEHLPKRVDVEPEWRILYTGSYNETEFTVSPLVEALRSWPERGRARPGVVFTGSPAPSVVRALKHRNESRFFGKRRQSPGAGNAGKVAIPLLCDAMSGPGTLLTKDLRVSRGKKADHRHLPAGFGSAFGPVFRPRAGILPQYRTGGRYRDSSGIGNRAIPMTKTPRFLPEGKSKTVFKRTPGRQAGGLPGIGGQFRRCANRKG